MANFSIGSEGDHIRLDVLSDWTEGHEVEETLAVWSQVADACREHGLERVLAVFHIRGKIPTMYGYEIANDPASVGIERRFKIALMYVDEQRYKSSFFTETIAVNRFYNVKVFNDEEAALEWLLQT